ncbi:MAG: sigma 54-interacting transcriptional regulator, partial [Deltaproteobacteria bacterium]|nr:sigma 54-interacting transcriptional regulator [Deltaproteobacteria bacterium]
MAAHVSTLGDKTTLDHATANGPLGAGSEPLVSLVLYHRSGAKVVPLGEASNVVVGRRYPADVVVDDLSLSRQHARFVREGAEVWVEDLGSTNGVRINGQRTERARVGLGDEVAMGAVTAVVQVLAPKDQLAEGLEPWDRFLSGLEQEVVRAQTFRRPLALVLLRASQRQGGHVSRWVQKARGRARPVDRLSLYGPGAVAATLPELGASEASAWAAAVVEDAAAAGLVAGVCVLPDGAAGADELLERARTAAQQATREQPVRVSNQLAPVAPAAPPDGFVTASPKMREIGELVKKLARSAIPVLIHGETGAGKEVIARALHEGGPRNGKALRTINCAAIPATLIESVLFGHEKGAFTGADRRSEGVFE